LPQNDIRKTSARRASIDYKGANNRATTLVAAHQLYSSEHPL